MTHGDKVTLPCTEAGAKQAEHTIGTLAALGHTLKVRLEVVAHTNLIEIEVLGKRPGEGQIAAEVKRRKG